MKKEYEVPVVEFLSAEEDDLLLISGEHDNSFESYVDFT